MMKPILFVAMLCCTLSACDVRTKDKMAGSTANIIAADSTGTGAGQAAATSVQIIDSSFNFGKVKDGEMVEFSYRFKNTGTQPLVISNAAASCGCTVPEKPEAPIMPGETGYIKVKFNSEGRVGQAHKTVTVSSNANPPFPTLMLTGEVIAKEN